LLTMSLILEWMAPEIGGDCFASLAMTWKGEGLLRKLRS
jgi:hypothetical protein